MDWLCQRQQGFGELQQHERICVFEFAMIWTYFESKVCAANANPTILVDTAREAVAHDAFRPEIVADAIAYFRARYVTEGALNERFPHLHFLHGQNEGLVMDVLLGKSNESADTLAAALLIVLRYRNNLFHGTKWGYNLRDQEQNFKISTNLLRGMVEIFDQIRPERR